MDSCAEFSGDGGASEPARRGASAACAPCVEERAAASDSAYGCVDWYLYEPRPLEASPKVRA